jgi:sugar lactone lactonase YvrE
MDPDNPEETLKLLDLVPMGSVADVAKALYPSNRWRDFHDFDKITLRVPEKCYVAPDGKTIIPYVYDLARCSSLVPAYPGKKMYASNEYDKRTVSCDVNADGTLSNLKYFTETGEFGLTAGPDGNIYIADGDVYVFSPEGKKLSVIKVPERPSTLAFGGKDGRTLFITGRHRVFTWRLR